MKPMIFDPERVQQGDLRGQLGRVEPQTLVLWGAEDNIVPLRDAGAVAEEWPRADLRLIPNAGHWPQFEQTDATLRHIAHFLGLPPALSDRPAERAACSVLASSWRHLCPCPSCWCGRSRRVRSSVTTRSAAG